MNKLPFNAQPDQRPKLPVIALTRVLGNRVIKIEIDLGSSRPIVIRKRPGLRQVLIMSANGNGKTNGLFRLRREEEA